MHVTRFERGRLLAFGKMLCFSVERGALRGFTEPALHLEVSWLDANYGITLTLLGDEWGRKRYREAVLSVNV